MAKQPRVSRDWLTLPIASIIDRELGRNPEVRRGNAAYAMLLENYQKTGDGEQLLASCQEMVSSAPLFFRTINLGFGTRSFAVPEVNGRTRPARRDRGARAGVGADGSTCGALPIGIGDGLSWKPRIA